MHSIWIAVWNHQSTVLKLDALNYAYPNLTGLDAQNSAKTPKTHGQVYKLNSWKITRLARSFGAGVKIVGLVVPKSCWFLDSGAQKTWLFIQPSNNNGKLNAWKKLVSKCWFCQSGKTKTVTQETHRTFPGHKKTINMIVQLVIH